MNDEKTVTIDGKTYRMDDLSDTAKQQLQNVQLADQEIARLKMQLALFQTGRNAYVNALKNELPDAAQ